MKKRLVKNPFFRAFIFLFALELVAISINFFYAPINIAAGGATGMAVLLEAAFGFNRSLCVLVINTLMLILAWIFIDWKTVKKFIIGSYLLPVLIYVTPSFEIVSDKLLAVILGGVFSAIGVAALYHGGQTGLVNVHVSCVQPVNNVLLHINAGYRVAHFRKTGSADKPDVAGTDNAQFHD